MKIDPTPLAYSVDQAISVTGIGRTKLYELIRCGELAAVKVGRRTLIRHRDLETLLERSLLGTAA